MRELVTLSMLATTHPHQAYSLLTRSFVPRWRFVMRTTDVDPSVYDPLENTLMEKFFPAAFGWTPKGDQELREVCALPTRLNGLAIPIPRDLAKKERAASKESVGQLVDAIHRQDRSFRQDSRSILMRKQEARERREKMTKELANSLLCLLYTSPSPRDISGSRMPSSA